MLCWTSIYKIINCFTKGSIPRFCINFANLCFPPHTKVIIGKKCRVETKLVQIISSLFLYWIPIEPAAESWAVAAQLVGDETHLAVVVLSREAEGEVFAAKAYRNRDRRAVRRRHRRRQDVLDGN